MEKQPTENKVRRRGHGILVGLMVLSGHSADAFTNLNPNRRLPALSRARLLEMEPPLLSSGHHQPTPANFHAKMSVVRALKDERKGDDNKNDDNHWTGQGMVAIIGKQARNLIEKGSSKLKDLAVRGTKSLKKALLPPESDKGQQFQRKAESNASIEREAEEQDQGAVVDTRDEALFRSLLEDETDALDPFSAASTTNEEVERLVDQAALLLQENALAVSVLGDPSSIQHSFPITQNSHTSTTSTVNGKSTSTTILETSFEVWGLKGQGVASVVAADGVISSLGLTADGQSYFIHPVSGNDENQTPQTSTVHQVPEPWDPEEAETVLEVEVMTGVRRLNPPKGSRIIDAEILEKKIIM